MRRPRRVASPLSLPSSDDNGREYDSAFLCQNSKDVFLFCDLFNSPLPSSAQHEVEFGVGILNKGKKNVKREKRVPTQIEVLAAVEREKQLKKAERKAAKVRLFSFFSLSESAKKRRLTCSFPCV